MGLSRWTRSIAAFSVLLIIVALVLHRLLGMPTLVALNLVIVGYGLAAVAFVLSIIATVAIWSTGEPGGGNVALGATLSMLVLLSPLIVYANASDLPAINDLTTDPANPLPFQKISALRELGANPVSYPGRDFKVQQQQFYPDLEPMQIDRSANETFALVGDALRRMNLEVVRLDPPGEDGSSAGFVEAVDRTLILGFYDDVAVRVTGDDKNARIDLRSASRFGRHDLGRNAERLREIMRQIVVRLEETVPAEDVREKKRPKKEKSPRLSTDQDRISRDRARARARRVQERRARQRRKPQGLPSYIAPIPGL